MFFEVPPFPERPDVLKLKPTPVVVTPPKFFSHNSLKTYHSNFPGKGSCRNPPFLLLRGSGYLGYVDRIARVIYNPYKWVKNVPKSQGYKPTLLQWLFLVPLKGGRWHIIPQLAVYTTYIPLIVLAFVWGLYNPKPTLYVRNLKNPLINQFPPPYPFHL